MNELTKMTVAQCAEKFVLVPDRLTSRPGKYRSGYFKHDTTEVALFAAGRLLELVTAEPEIAAAVMDAVASELVRDAFVIEAARDWNRSVPEDQLADAGLYEVVKDSCHFAQDRAK